MTRSRVRQEGGTDEGGMEIVEETQGGGGSVWRVNGGALLS